MESAIQSYDDLVAWRLAVEAAKEVYSITASFPSDERFGLAQQLQRAAVSIPSNIAEGFGRGLSSYFARFLRMARGSLYEVETQFILAIEFGYLAPSDHELVRPKLEECGRVLAGLLRSVESRTA